MNRPDPPSAPGAERLQKLMARAGLCSRRQAEEWIVQGRVRVNGQIVTTLGTRVDPERDDVHVDGRPLTRPAARWIMLNKPPRILTTRRDPEGRTTLYDILPEELRHLRYVGRLDRDTEGLLILTNEGEAAHRLLHPSSEVEREYLAAVRGTPDRDALRRLVEGVELDDGPARAEQVRLVSSNRTRGARVSLVLREGRKREVRRLLAAVGHPVRHLRRVRFGPLELGDLPRGAWRDLTRAEVKALLSSTEDP